VRTINVAVGRLWWHVRRQSGRTNGVSKSLARSRCVRIPGANRRDEGEKRGRKRGWSPLWKMIGDNLKARRDSTPARRRSLGDSSISRRRPEVYHSAARTYWHFAGSRAWATACLIKPRRLNYGKDHSAPTWRTTVASLSSLSSSNLVWSPIYRARFYVLLPTSSNSIRFFRTCHDIVTFRFIFSFCKKCKF